MHIREADIGTTFERVREKGGGFMYMKSIDKFVSKCPSSCNHTEIVWASSSGPNMYIILDYYETNQIY